MKNVKKIFIFTLLNIIFINNTPEEKNIYDEFKQINETNKDFINISIDKVAEFWNQRPCNIKHSSKLIGTKDYFDEVEQKKYFVEPHVPEFADFNNWKGKRVLEIGCGIGTESINFVKAGAILSAIELSKESLDLTKERFKVFGLNANLYQGNAENLETILPEKDRNSFDLVWSFGVIHHTPNPKNIIEGIKKFIKKDGELRIMLYSKISYKLFFIMRQTGCWDFSKLDTLVSQYSEAQIGCPVTYTYTPREILELIGNGWDNISIQKTHIFPYKIDKYVQNIYEKEDAWKNIAEEQFKEFEKELGWHYLIKATFKGE